MLPEKVENMHRWVRNKCFTNGTFEALLCPNNGNKDERNVFWVRGVVICLWVAVCRWVISIKKYAWNLWALQFNVYATEFLRLLIFRLQLSSEWIVSVGSWELERLPRLSCIWRWIEVLSWWIRACFLNINEAFTQIWSVHLFLLVNAHS